MQFCEYHNILCFSGATCTKPTARKSASFVLAPLQFSENTTQMQTSRSEQQRGEEVHSIVPIAHVSIAESSVPFKAPLGFNFRRLFPFFFYLSNLQNTPSSPFSYLWNRQTQETRSFKTYFSVLISTSGGAFARGPRGSAPERSQVPEQSQGRRKLQERGSGTLSLQEQENRFQINI